MLSRACAFTGHRPTKFSFGYNEDDQRCLALKEQLTEIIEQLVNNGVCSFYSGMALGVDQWAAQAVLNLKAKYPQVRLIAVLPCESQANNWTWRQQDIYQNLLNKCDEIQIIGKYYTSHCMFQRNRRLVDQADHLIAVYDGCQGGGTTYTVNYARKKGRQIIIINDLSLFHR